MKSQQEIKDLIYFALDEITAIDQRFRLESESISNPAKRRDEINRVFIATCEKFGIEYKEEDLLPSGDEVIKNIFELSSGKLKPSEINDKIQEIKNRQKFHEKENKKRLERSGINEHYQLHNSQIKNKFDCT